jgi:hypothetical protein
MNSRKLNFCQCGALIERHVTKCPTCQLSLDESLTYDEKLSACLDAWIAKGNTPEEFGVLLVEGRSPRMCDRVTARNKIKGLPYGHEVYKQECE